MVILTACQDWVLALCTASKRSIAMQRHGPWCLDLDRFSSCEPTEFSLSLDTHLLGCLLPYV